MANETKHYAVIDGTTVYYVDTELVTEFNPHAHSMAYDLAKGWGFDGYQLLPGWDRTQETNSTTPVRLLTTDRYIADDFVKNYTAD